MCTQSDKKNEGVRSEIWTLTSDEGFRRIDFRATAGSDYRWGTTYKLKEREATEYRFNRRIPIRYGYVGADEWLLDIPDGLYFGQADRALVGKRWKGVAPGSKGIAIPDIVHVRHFGTLQSVLDLVDERRYDPAGQNDQKQERIGQACSKFD